MAPNIQKAKKYFRENNAISGNFSEYSAAYSITNEDLRTAFELTMPQNTKNALVVAASGDHPMFAKLYGAQNVDTFDVSYNAKCIMDIKTAALHMLTYKDYCDLISNIYVPVDIYRVNNVPKILDGLPSEERNYIKEMHTCPIFGNGLHPIAYDKYLPTVEEFEKMRSVIDKPFDFTWSKITTVHYKLKDKKYDFMHLSNIIDYYRNEDDRACVLLPLMEMIRPNGAICFQTFRNIPDWFHDYCKTQEKIKNKKWVMIRPGKDALLYVLQRVK